MQQLRKIMMDDNTIADIRDDVGDNNGRGFCHSNWVTGDKRCSNVVGCRKRPMPASYGAFDLGPMVAGYLDEVFISINGRRMHLWRPVDGEGEAR